MVDGLFFGHFFWKVRRAVHIHGSNVWRGHLRVERAFTCGEAFMCGGGIYVWELFTCGGDIYMWRGIYVWRGHLRVERHLRVEGTFTCGSYLRVESS